MDTHIMPEVMEVVFSKNSTLAPPSKKYILIIPIYCHLERFTSKSTSTIFKILPGFNILRGKFEKSKHKICHYATVYSPGHRLIIQGNLFLDVSDKMPTQKLRQLGESPAGTKTLMAWQ